MNVTGEIWMVASLIYNLNIFSDYNFKFKFQPIIPFQLVWKYGKTEEKMQTPAKPIYHSE